MALKNEKSKTTTAEINYTGSETITIEPFCAKKIKSYKDNGVGFRKYVSVLGAFFF